MEVLVHSQFTGPAAMLRVQAQWAVHGPQTEVRKRYEQLLQENRQEAERMH